MEIYYDNGPCFSNVLQDPDETSYILTDNDVNSCFVSLTIFISMKIPLLNICNHNKIWQPVIGLNTSCSMHEGLTVTVLPSQQTCSLVPTPNHANRIMDGLISCSYYCPCKADCQFIMISASLLQGASICEILV